MSTFKQKLEEFEQKRTELIQQLRDEFPSLLKEEFEKTEKIKSIGWPQYTPYFNDGDECIFSVHIDEYQISINGSNLYNEDDLGGYPNFLNKEIWNGKAYVPNPHVDEKEVAIFDSMLEKLQEIPDDFMKEIFGDHVEVTIYSNGKTKVEKYNHD